MFTIKKTLFFVLSVFAVIISFQNCSSEYKIKNGQEIVSVEEGVATVEVTPEENQDKLLLKVPSEFMTAEAEENEENAFKWIFVDEDGNEMNLQNTNSEFDLTGLDKNFFSHGIFKVTLHFNNVVKTLIFIIRFDLIGQPVIGLPLPEPPMVVGAPMPVGLQPQIVGVSPQPVGLVIDRPAPVVPMPVGLQPQVVGVSPQPVGLVIDRPVPVVPMPVGLQPQVVGISPQPVGLVIDRPMPVGLVVGVPPKPDPKPVGMPFPIGKRVIDVQYRPVGIRVINFPYRPVGIRVINLPAPKKK